MAKMASKVVTEKKFGRGLEAGRRPGSVLSKHY